MNTTPSDTIALLVELVRRNSVTPDDKGCQAMIGERLARLGFVLESMPSGGVTNLWARLGTEAPLFAFAGHTDVVPTGNEEDWSSPPFAADIIDDHLVGRGAADMKGGVAAMVTAIERFVESGAHKHGSIALLLTSDEEGPATDGTTVVINKLEHRNEKIDYCIVGEPTSTNKLGDTIRHGRRGSLGATLIIRGIQGHVAYPHLADNPIHRAMPALNELTTIEWDKGNDHFPPTTLQISNFNAGTGATNVIPGQASVEFNLRYSPETSIEHIQSTIKELCSRHQLDTTLIWKDSARPFITTPGTLTQAMQQAIVSETGITATLDTGGGTSDGRFIAPTGAQTIEFGPINATIHQVNERVSCTDINSLTRIYESVLQQLLG
ncbi:succinyl-diaminopimelate desuccinylase [Granulosicoccus antarcticus]|uniref:Succinyl-diaminopimelate desuccinylase n=1 Tax=Granulosicoccus antarcticus IMCC3135 TaxID=1192854 RepID=A0A2Z2NZ30_9GAMM|nr:succinyl-diaminopimelate desuccinylase [Granulosicoccus antarcticus]ASJ75171.1 Succinyl-diaminopimelate desuccinylase [Granulosicoccus antarcticus IMCC3135]